MKFPVAKLGDVCSFIRGLTYSKSDEVEFSSNIVVRATNIDLSTHKLDFSELRYISDSIQVKDDKRLKKDDILICTASGSKSHLGKVAIVESDLGMAFGGFMGALRVSPSKITPQYLFTFLVSDVFKKHIESLSDGANINNLKFSQIENLEIPLPPTTTQQKIVSKLDAIFAEIDKATAAAEANAKNAEALFQSYLTKIFECDSEGWKDAALGNLYKVASSKRVLKSDWKSEGVPFYRGREITSLSKFGFVENDLFITEEMYAEYSRTYGVPLADDIMITAIGTIGNTYIVKEGDKFYFKDASVLWLKKEADIDSKFVNYWFKSRHFFSQLDVGLGATVDTLTIGKVQGLQIKIPTVSTQKDVVAKLDSVSSEIAKSIKSYTDKVNEIGKLKDSILRQAFSGELVKE